MKERKDDYVAPHELHRVLVAGQISWIVARHRQRLLVLIQGVLRNLLEWTRHASNLNYRRNLRVANYTLMELVSLRTTALLRELLFNSVLSQGSTKIIGLFSIVGAIWVMS